MSQLASYTGGPLLGPGFPLPLDAPFTTRQAAAAGVTRRTLSKLVHQGYLRRPLLGVYVAAQVPDTLNTRARALLLAVPDGSAVVDWTATWLHTGVLPFGHHHDVPPVALFRLPGHGRLRNAICHSGERALTAEDVMHIEGITVTTPLRSALDVGRLSRRDDAIVGLDALLRSGGFSHEELLDQVERFRRQRGVVQLRALAPLADPRAQSGGESVLRLRWRDLPSLPPPVPQVPIRDDTGSPRYWLDLGVEEIRFAAEYDGEAHHSLQTDLAHDRKRRAWIEDARDWIIEPVRKDNLFGVSRDVDRILTQGVVRARRRLGGHR